VTPSESRFLRIISALAARDVGPNDSPTLLRTLCELTPDLLSVNGAAVSLWDGAMHAGLICAAGPSAEMLDDLHVLLGEGPAVDAHAGNTPVLAPELAADGRWIEFSRSALQQGVSAVFGFPLQIGAIRIGVLTLHRTIAGSLSGAELADALVVSDIATHLLLAIKADEGVGAIPLLAELGGDWSVIRQATGMTAVQLGSTVQVAFARLRAYAFANEVALRQAAADIVARRLRFARIDETDSC
jgi:hypothetical protein